MEEKELRQFLEKKVFINLKSGRFYSGKINSIKNNSVTLTDKFGDIVLFDISEISSIETEERDNKE